MAAGSEIIDGLAVPDGPLGRPQLQRVSATFAARADLWRPHHDRGASVRTFAPLHQDGRLDVWALFWVPETDTGWHDHDVSSGSVTVVEGALEEHALVLGAAGGDGVRRDYAAPATFSFGPEHIHRVTCAVPRAISIHAYSPPLDRLGQYSFGTDGVLRRESVSADEELRPQEAVAA